MKYVLAIDEPLCARALAVQQHARLHRFSMIDLINMLNDDSRVPGLDEAYCVHVPINFKVVYTVEQQPAPIGWCQHVSVSHMIDGRHTLPPVNVVSLGILPLFKLKLPEAIKVWEETFDAGQCINLLFKYDGL